MILLIASVASKKDCPVPGVFWYPVTWRTRSGKRDCFFGIADVDDPPEGYILDERYAWRVTGTEVKAYFAEREFINAWHSEHRGAGELSRKPRVIFSEIRELNIYEKLAAAAPAPEVIAPVVRRPPALTGGNLPQSFRLDMAGIIEQYSERLRQRKAEFAKETVAQQAEVRHLIGELAREYGLPVPVVPQLPA